MRGLRPTLLQLEYFLSSNNESNNVFHWDEVCHPKLEGVLGIIRHLWEINEVRQASGCEGLLKKRMLCGER